MYNLNKNQNKLDLSWCEFLSRLNATYTCLLIFNFYHSKNFC